MQPDQSLAARLADWPRPFFATIDGARFADARRALWQAELPARSLLLEQRDAAAIAAGPFLAMLDGTSLARLLRLPGVEQACVFWSGELGEAAMFRHLRSLNMARIPRPASALTEDPGPKTEMVLFRHWDPSVLVMMLPIFEPAQRARVFGPVKRLALFDASSGQALQSVARADWAVSSRGPLALTQDQMDQVAATMAIRSRRKVVTFLRDAAPALTAARSDADLLRAVEHSEASGRALGLHTEQGLGRWAYLMLVSKGTIERSEPAKRFVMEGPEDPDTRLGALLLGLASELNRRERA